MVLSATLKVTSETLTRAQAEGTKLVLENRELKSNCAALQERNDRQVLMIQNQRGRIERLGKRIRTIVGRDFFGQ